MTSESNRVSSASLAYIQSVSASWGWSWQPISQENDDGLDGLLYIRDEKKSNEKPTDRRYWKHVTNGGVIQVQIKSGDSYIKLWGSENFEIAIADLETKKDLWKKSPLPCTLIFVQSVPQGKSINKAWWVDLKLETSYTQNGRITIPLKNRFGIGLECRKPFSRLANGQLRALSLETINMKEPGRFASTLPGGMSTPLKKAAWGFYSSWKSEDFAHPLLGNIIVNRTGWSHITRQGRPLSRIETSFRLLPAAARILETVHAWKVLRRGKTTRIHPDASWSQLDFLGVSANVIFPARARTEVIVILKRELRYFEIPQADAIDNAERKFEVHSRIWFYSVYEPGRGKDI